MFTPWNESCPGEHLSFGSFAIPLAQNLSHQSHAIPLGPTPWNACPVKSDRYFTGACPMKSLFLFLWASMLYALCSMLAIPLGRYAPCPVPHPISLLLFFALLPLPQAKRSFCPFLFTLYSMPHALCPMRHALCPLHHACRSTGARPFFEQVSHKAPSTQRVRWNFFALNHRPCALAISCLL